MSFFPAPSPVVAAPRARYRPSGRVDLARFAPLALAVVAAAGLAAALLDLGWRRAFYAPIVFPLGAAILVGALALLAVRLGRCRSPAAALLLGLSGALMVHPGPHVLSYVRDLGPREVVSPAGFLRHLDDRLARTALSWGMPPRIAEPAEDGRAREPGPLDHWTLRVVLVLDLLGVLAIVALSPWTRVRREPYCESCGSWTERHRLAFRAGAHEALIAALDERRLQEVAAATHVPFHPNHSATIGRLHLCGHPTCTSRVATLSLHRSDGDAAARMAMEDLFPWQRLRPRCALLEPSEVEGLRRLLPEAAEDGGTEAVLPSWARGLDEGPDGSAAGFRAGAKVERVEQPEPPPVVSRRLLQWIELLDLGVLLLGAATGLGLLVLAAELDPERTLTHPVALAAFACMLGSVAFIVKDREFFASRYVLGRVAARLERRPAPLVRPADPDALPVVLVPRGVWSRPENAALVDYGWLAVRGGEILYEGDSLRIRVPGSAVLGIALEPLVVDQYQTRHFAVVTARGGEKLHAFPWAGTAWPLARLLTSSEKRRSRELAARLGGALGVAEAAAELGGR